MQLYLQFGWGMMGLVRELLASWQGGGVILSPRDLKKDQLIGLGKDVTTYGSESLLDPQCYARDADHARLRSHRYWQLYAGTSTNQILSAQGAEPMLEELGRLNRDISASRIILPGLLARSVDADWLRLQEVMIQEGRRIFGEMPLLATVALSAESLKNEHDVEAVIDAASKWDVQGFYVVPETPGSYLVDDPAWLANLLFLSAGLRLHNKPVIVGYCSHQMLLLACARVDVVCSGTYLNVRSFPPDKFYEQEESTPSRRSTWYYTPHALSEYKLHFLDIADRSGILSELRPDALMPQEYSQSLFSGAAPSTVNWREPDAFRHYLGCLNVQASAATLSSFEGTVDHHLRLLNDAESTLQRYAASGVLGSDRDFRERVDVNRSALTLFSNGLGPRMKRAW